MSALTVDAERLRSVISFEDLIEPVARAFEEFSSGSATSDAIVMYPGSSRESGDVLIKTSSSPGEPIYLVKISPWFAANVRERRPQGGFVAAFDSQTGHTLAIFNDEHYLSDIRTAAAGALAARVLAPRHVNTAAVVGAGTQAYWQVRALRHERTFTELIVCARDSEKGQRLATRLAAEIKGLHITVTDEPERAVRSADVVITTTPAREPLIEGRWLRPGQHITAIGADTPEKCELDAECFARADVVVVDSISDAFDYGEIARHTASGELNAAHLHGEMGAVLSGACPGRTSQEQITIAKFVGLGVQDLVTATAALKLLRPL